MPSLAALERQVEILPHGSATVRTIFSGEESTLMRTVKKTIDGGEERALGALTTREAFERERRTPSTLIT